MFGIFVSENPKRKTLFFFLEDISRLEGSLNCWMESSKEVHEKCCLERFMDGNVMN